MASLGLMDWTSSENVVLLNPRMPDADKQKMMSALDSSQELNLDSGSKGCVDLTSSTAESRLKGHIFLATSGSSGRLKWVALSKEAILASAKAVNEHLQCSFHDVWLNPLPSFHVGGLGIYARSFLSQACCINFHSMKWNPSKFLGCLHREKASLTSLVPAQVFDLAAKQLKAPNHLRAVVVGGGALSEKVYHEAVSLGWPLLPSYGLTECASQVATAALGSWKRREFPELEPLAHVSLECTDEGYLKIKSPALLTGYIHIAQDLPIWSDPKIHGWLTTEDMPIMSEGKIRSIGREGGFVKIGGESVDMLRLENILDMLRLSLNFHGDAVVVALPDERLGHSVSMVTTNPNLVEAQGLVDRFHEKVFPFEKIQKIFTVKEIPRSPLKKVLMHALMQLLT